MEIIKGKHGSYMKFSSGKDNEKNPYRSRLHKESALLPPVKTILDFDTPKLQDQIRLLQDRASAYAIENQLLREENALLRNTIEHVRADAKLLHGVI